MTEEPEVPAPDPSEPEVDPRLFRPECASLSECLLDLDTIERYHCIIIVKRMEKTYKKSERFDKNMLPALWSAAHDRAIQETASARQSALLNGQDDWDSRSWRPTLKEDANAKPDPKPKA